jgi:hypothetical protein
MLWSDDRVAVRARAQGIRRAGMGCAGRGLADGCGALIKSATKQ